MSRANDTRYIKWHETCKCKCRIDASVCNNKQRWNEDKCRCECKESNYNGICDKGFIWTPSNCKCECQKSCDVGEYIDYENSKCRKRLIDKLVEECTENIDEKELHQNKMIHNSTLNDCEKICSSCESSSCTVYIVLFAIFSIISISVSSVFIYFTWHLKIKCIETTNY